MPNAELIALVSKTLAVAQQRNDAPIIEICSELGSRLVAEMVPAEAAPVAESEPSAPVVEQPVECAACADRRVRRAEVQRRMRSKKKKAAGNK